MKAFCWILPGRSPSNYQAVLSRLPPSFEGRCFKPQFDRASMPWSEAGREQWNMTTHMYRRRLCSILYFTVLHPRWARLVFPSPSFFDQVPWRPFPLAWPCWGPMMSLHPTLVGPCQFLKPFHRIQQRLCTRACRDSSKQKQHALHTCLLFASVTTFFSRFIFPSPSSIVTQWCLCIRFFSSFLFSSLLLLGKQLRTVPKRMCNRCMFNILPVHGRRWDSCTFVHLCPQRPPSCRRACRPPLIAFSKAVSAISDCLTLVAHAVDMSSMLFKLHHATATMRFELSAVVVL